jgi:hypothetical protein
MRDGGTGRGAALVALALSLAAAAGGSAHDPSTPGGGTEGITPARVAAEVAALFCSAPPEVAPTVAFGVGAVADVAAASPRRFDAGEPLPYYAIDLVTTKRLPGTARASGVGHVTFASSPFGIAVAPDGSYRYDVSLQVVGVESPADGVLVVWITTPEVDRIQRLGALDASGAIQGPVSWNKFLVVVTLEPKDDPSSTAWSGPIVLRGMSRSGMMHTMAGHGPFQQELCAKYGYR